MYRTATKLLYSVATSIELGVKEFPGNAVSKGTQANTTQESPGVNSMGPQVLTVWAHMVAKSQNCVP